MKNLLSVLATVVAALALAFSTVTAFNQPQGTNIEIALLWLIILVGDMNILILRGVFGGEEKIKG